MRAQRCRLADKCAAEAEQKSQEKRERFDLCGDELLSKTAGMRSRSKGNSRYSEDEVEHVVRIGCCSSGASRSAVAATAETVFMPIHRKTVHFWRWKRFYDMGRINRKVILDFTSEKISGVAVRFDVSPPRLWGGIKQAHQYPALNI